MMVPLGWRVVEYSNGVSESAAEHVVILSRKELSGMSKRGSEHDTFTADIQNFELTRVFIARVIDALKRNVSDGDIVCHVFGPMKGVTAATPRCLHVESGIGYTCTADALPYRIYESAGWMSWHYGKRGLVQGNNYEFVAPNYYDLDEWPIVTRPNSSAKGSAMMLSNDIGTRSAAYVLFFGRITNDKGMNIILAIAKEMPDTRFILCGQGDGTQWTDNAENVTSIAPVSGLARAAVLGNASVLLAPTQFIEPFCGSAVEAQLCGTPVVTTGYGAFWETVDDGVTGFRCNTLADFVGAVRRAPLLDRTVVAERARRLYSMETVGKTYDTILNSISDMSSTGWFSPHSYKFDSGEVSGIFLSHTMILWRR